MLEGLFAWLSDVDGRLTFFVVPVDNAEEWFSWTDSIAALIGAAASAAAALLVLRISTHFEKRRRVEDRSRHEAGLALSTFSKLSRYANNILAIKNAIDEAFKNANDSGLNTEDPSQIVGFIPGKFVEPEKLKSEEYAFLFTKRDFEIVGEIEDMEAGAVHLVGLLEEYNRRQNDLQAWFDATLGIKRDIAGVISRDMVPVALKGNLDHRVSQLNVLLSQMLVVTENETMKPIEVVRSYVTAASVQFGHLFPKIDYR